MRFLYSDPLLGPLGSLLAAVPGAAEALEQPVVPPKVLTTVLELERQQQRQRQACPEAVAEALRRRGWRLEREHWEEALRLTLGDGLLQRWFGPGGDYRRQLQRLLTAAELDGIAQLFRRHRGIALPQPLRHLLLRAQRNSAAASHEKSPGEAGAAKM